VLLVRVCSTARQSCRMTRRTRALSALRAIGPLQAQSRERSHGGGAWKQACIADTFHTAECARRASDRLAQQYSDLCGLLRLRRPNTLVPLNLVLFTLYELLGFVAKCICPVRTMCEREERVGQ